MPLDEPLGAMHLGDDLLGVLERAAVSHLLPLEPLAPRAVL